ncbi:MAG: hypothetical protein R6V19_09460 [Armatimonadota bacterium]
MLRQHDRCCSRCGNNGCRQKTSTAKPGLRNQLPAHQLVQEPGADLPFPYGIDVAQKTRCAI